MYQVSNDELVQLKIITAGDEIALEDKVNAYLAEATDRSLLDYKINQIEYHSRAGTVDFALLATLVMRVKRS